MIQAVLLGQREVCMNSGTFYIIYHVLSGTYLTRRGNWTDNKYKAIALTRLKNIEDRYNKLSPDLKRDCIITER